MLSPWRVVNYLSLLLHIAPALHTAPAARAELGAIDDTYGDSVTGAKPSYSSDGEDCWNQGPGCAACVLQPDPSMAYNGTWHETTSNMCNNAVSDQSSAGHSVSFNFTGTVTAMVRNTHADHPVLIATP